MPGRPFSEGIAELKRIVGTGKLDATVTVAQVYAAPQERSFWETGPLAGVRIRNHPGGGGGNFLGSQIAERAPHELQSWLSRAISDRIPTIDSARQFGEAVAKGVETRAPVEFNNLRRSAAVTVTDDGAVVFEKPATVPRLSRDQLRALARNRRRAF